MATARERAKFEVTMIESFPVLQPMNLETNSLYVCAAHQFHKSITQMVDDADKCDSGLSRDDLRQSVLFMMLAQLVPAGNC